MAQLSRPYQIGLAAILVLAAAWLLLLQGHSSSPSTAGSSPAPTAVTTTTTVARSKAHKAAGSTHKAAGSSHIYHGAAPGVEGLTRDIAKAHGAVETSQANAKQLQEKSEQASSASPSSSSTASAPATTAAAPTKASAPVKSSAPAKTAAPAAASTSSNAPALQRSVEAELNAGKIVVILFWNSKGADDSSVRQAVAQIQHKSHLGIAVHLAGSSQVSDFGTITRGVQVYGTPTLLVVNKKDQVLTLTGLQDAYTIEQSILEAKHS